MPPQPLVERALAGAIVVLLTVGGAAAARGQYTDLAVGTERATPTAAVLVRAASERAGTAGGSEFGAEVLASAVTVPADEATESAAPDTTVATSSTTTTITAAPATTTTAPSTTAAPAPTTTSSTTSTTAPPPTTSPPSTTAAPPAPAGTTRDAGCESSMLDWMNQARAGAGRGAVAEDEAVQHVSLDWSNHMATTGELAHNPHYSDQIFADRPEARTAGEVVGWSSSSARAVFDEFMRSSIHRGIILEPAFRYATVACVWDAGGRVWVTADFWG